MSQARISHLVGNPEFRRNLWLELTPHRALMMPVVLGAIFLFVGQFDPSGWGTVVGHVALGLAALMSIVWGGYQAGEAVFQEVRERTWDSQRMSALGPWPMTWGKLFGSTVFTWYGTVICLLVYLIGSRGEPAELVFKIAIIAAAAAILVQSVNVIVALTSVRLVQQVKGAHGIVTSLFTLVMLWVAYTSYFETSGPVLWFGRQTPVLDFLTGSLVALAAWGVLGMYRMMCMELLVPTLPWAWAAFIAYLTVFIGGTFADLRWPAPSVVSVLSDMGFAVSIAGAYITAFTSYRDRLALRRMNSYASGRQWRRMLEEIPLWLVSAAAAALFATACWLLGPAPDAVGTYAASVGAAALPLWLLMIRDLLILLFFSYSPSAHRPALTAITYLVLLHWLIPSLLRLFGLVKSSWLFSPPVSDRPVLSSLVIAVHVVIAGTLAWHRYRARVAPPRSTSQTTAGRS